jgi:hypothetical protein
MKKITFEEFQTLWLEQECLTDDNQLIEEIEDSFNYSEIFDVIRLWSRIPLTERVNNFLKRNDVEIDYNFD